MKLHDLLKRGYFPKELPPPFTTEPFGSLIENNPNFIPALSQGPSETLPARHSLSRAGALRRVLSIPNPLSFLMLSEWFEQNWSTAINQCSKSSISLSAPLVGSSGRVIVPKVPFHEQPIHKAALRAKSRFILKTDVTNCYPSIYTHSISWAIHTKSVAKASKRTGSLVGNSLDKLISNGQHGQTIGIPIGPDTSFIVAEMLLSSVDEEFCSRMAAEHLQVNGYRSFDDFEFGFTARADAEAAVSILQKVLAEYEMQLNPSKTHIVELPVPLEPAWVSELRSFRFDSAPFKWDLRKYFDRAFELSRSHRDSEVLKYAIQRLRSVDIPTSDFDLFQNFLLQCAMVEPGALSSVVDQLHHYENQGITLDKPKIGEVFNILLNTHAPLAHGSEVAWTLWGCLLFGLVIDNNSASSVADMEDPFAALLLMHAQDSGLIRGNLNLQNWQVTQTGAGLRDHQWLVSYEANIKGWLQTPKDHVISDPQFVMLKQHGVSFYDQNIVNTHVPSAHFHPASGAGNVGGYVEV